MPNVYKKTFCENSAGRYVSIAAIQLTIFLMAFIEDDGYDHNELGVATKGHIGDWR